MTGFFNVTQLSTKKYRVASQYNKYTVIVDQIKGIGIYMVLADNQPELLVKAYNHCKMETAINYLWKKEMFCKP